MAPIVIDLTSSPEPETPTRAAKSVLDRLQAHKEQRREQGAGNTASSGPNPQQQPPLPNGHNGSAQPQPNGGLQRTGDLDGYRSRKGTIRPQKGIRRLAAANSLATLAQTAGAKEPATQPATVGGVERPPSMAEDDDGIFERPAKRRRTHVSKARMSTATNGTPPHTPSEGGHAALAAPPRATSSGSKHGSAYTEEDNALLKQLKEVDNLPWSEILPHFKGRTMGSLQVHYSTKLRDRSSAVSRQPELERVQATSVKIQKASPAIGGQSNVERVRSIPHRPSPSAVQSASPDREARPKRVRKPVAAADGFVNWADIRTRHDEPLPVQPAAQEEEEEDDTGPILGPAEERSVARLIRQRELGIARQRASIPDELKNHVFSEHHLVRDFQGTCGDVVALSWGAGGNFAAGSIAISDSRSMQYNMQRNLLVGHRDRVELQELTEHHVERPVVVDDPDNVNALGSMRETQDPRLFLTVTATDFSPNGSRLYTASADKTVRGYRRARDGRFHCQYTIDHPASVDLLASSASGILATACHSASDSINIYRCRKNNFEHRLALSPSRNDLQSDVAIFPTSMKWGIAPLCQNFIAAGFAAVEQKDLAGETCIWDATTGQEKRLHAATRNVFDLAWNPNASTGSIALAVASSPSSINVGRGMRTVIQCFASNLQRVLAWECPALDINDVIFCKHDENLIAAGATDGTVYVWDRRFADRAQKPLHRLRHEESLNILEHDVDHELTDTGVRFLSWGATSSRLYSGSSDGVVRVWNPYREEKSALVNEIAVPPSKRSAIMSGMFRPDYRDLLIGTENGRINLFGIEQPAGGKTRTFKLLPQRESEDVSAGKPDFSTANDLLATKRIELRPCGTMPFRQAVQGPGYDGPFLLGPSTAEATAAESRLQDAVTKQNDLALANDENPDYTDKEEIANAEQAVLDAQAAVTGLQARFDFVERSKPAAEAFQRSLYRAERQRRKDIPGHHEQCKLDCRVLRAPVAEYDDNEVDDSRRSELRIPGTLRFAARAAPQNVSADDDGASAKSCPTCFPFAKLPAGTKRTICDACRLKRLGLISSCTQCGRPARVADGVEKAVCETCAFACFHCGGAADVDWRAETISCARCGVEWEMGVLGFEVVGGHGDGGAGLGAKGGHRDKGEVVHVGDEMREYYASMAGE